MSIDNIANEENTQNNTEQNAEQSSTGDTIGEPASEITSENTSEEQAPSAEEPSETEDAEVTDSGARVRQYSFDTLHEGIDRLGRLDQAYAEGQPDTEEIQGVPDGPINAAPFFEAGITSASSELSVQESGVVDGNNPVTGTDTVSGSVTATDPEGGPLQYFFKDASGNPTQELELEHGTISIDPDTGDFVYTLNNDDSVTQGLNEGDTGIDTVDVYVQDEEGLEGLNTLPLTITIEGTNDQPTLTVEGEPLAVNEDGTLEDSATALGEDVDSEAVLSYAIVESPDDGTTESVSTSEGTYGALSIDPNTGDYTYTLFNGDDGEASLVQSLAEGELVSESFTIRVQDEHGSWTDKPITVNITGTNDAPTVDVDASQLSDVLVQESGVQAGGNEAESGDMTASGVVAGTDIDSDNPQGSGLVYTIAGGTLIDGNDGGADGGALSTLSTTYGTLTLNTTTGAYTFQLDDAAVDSFGLGDSVTEPFTVTITDAQGATATQALSFTIQGTNDQPTLSLSEQSLAVAEGGILAGGIVSPAVLQDDGLASRDDVDSGNTLRYAVASQGQDTTQASMQAAFDDEPTETAGQYGTLSINENTGQYVYTLDAEKADSLAQDQTYNEQFTIYVQDEHGAWTWQDLTVTVTGGNDVPTINAGSYLTLKDSGMVTDTSEDAKGRTSNEATVAGEPQDLADNLDNGAESNGTSHKLAGSANVGGSDVDSGATLTYSFVADDGSYINETGTYTIAGMDHTVTVDGTSQSLATAYGTMTLNTATGEYIYELDASTGGTVDAMQENEWHTEQYIVGVQDEHGVTAGNTHGISIYIEGTNEQPSLQLMDISGENVLNQSGNRSSITILKESGVVDMPEDGDNDVPDIPDDGGNTEVTGIMTTSGLLVGSDVDTGATLSYGLITSDGTHWYPSSDTDTYTREGRYGTFTLSADGSYTYTLYDEPDDDASANEIAGYARLDALAEGRIVSDTVTLLVRDEEGAWSTATFKVKLEGTNDSPQLSVGPNLEVWEEGGSFIDSGEASHTDVDSGASGLYSFGAELDATGNMTPILTLSTDYGTVRINPQTGAYEYVLDTQLEAVQALHDGETLQDSFTVYVTDDKGATDTKPVSVTINGTDDAPVFGGDSNIGMLFEAGVEVDGNAATGVQSDVEGVSVISGQFTATDADAGDTEALVYSLDTNDDGIITIEGVDYVITEDSQAGTQSVTTAHGTMVLTMATGAYIYTLNQEATDSLLPGQSLSESIGVVATDASGLTANTALLLTIEGTNDAPVIELVQSDINATVDEDASGQESNVSGTIVANDVDHIDSDLSYSFVSESGDSASLVQTLQGEYGHIVLNQSTGEYTYVLDSDKAASLSAGTVATESFPVRVVDALRAHDDASLTITITGADDAPVITIPSPLVREDSGVIVSPDASDSTETPQVAGAISVTDVDTEDEASFELMQSQNADATVTSQTEEDGSISQTIQGQYGTLTLQADGTYIYTLDDNATDTIQTLNEGQNLSDTFDVQVSSGPASQMAQIAVQIAGTNDAPELTLSNLGTVNENDISLSASVPFYVHNEAVPLNPDTGEASGYTDMDTGASHTFGFLAVYDASTGTYRAATETEVAAETYEVVQSMQGEYGMLTISQDGTYTYLVDRHNPTVDGMEDGESLEDSFMLSVIDEHGAMDTAPVTVTITGSSLEDGPQDYDVDILSVETVTVAEDGNLSDDTAPISQEGDIVLSDTGYATAPHLENNGTPTSSIVGQYGTLTLGTHENGQDVTYTFTLHQGVDAVDSLYDGQVVELSYPVFINGEEQGSIAISITGTNDAPILDVASYSHSINEEADNPSISGTVLAHDIDDAAPDAEADTDGKESLSYSLSAESGTVDYSVAGYESVATDYGTMSLNTSTGDYTYTLTNEADLPAGTNPQELFTVLVSDGKESVEAPITITINAENTAPELTLSALQISEDMISADGQVVASGLPTITDLDTADGPFSYAIADAEGNNAATVVQGEYGSLILDAETGEYSYVLNNQSEAVQSLGEGESASDSFTYTVTDIHGGQSSQTLSVTIDGTNDMPELSVDTVNMMAQESGDTVTGQATVSDIDSADSADGAHTFSMEYTDADGVVHTIEGGSGDTLTTAYGTVTLTADGQYSYTADSDNPLTKALAQGETASETITLLVQDSTGEALGEAVSQDITVTLKGTNSAPELSLSDVLVSDAINESGELGANISQSDTSFVFSGDAAAETFDADTASEDLRFAINSTDDPNTEPSASETVQRLEGNYGTLEIDATTGAYTYTVDQSLVSELGAVGNESLTETFTLLVRDEYGEIAQQQMTMTVAGTNDAPTLTVSETELAVTEDGGNDDTTDLLVARGVAVVEDADTGESHSFGLRYVDANGDELFVMAEPSDTSTSMEVMLITAYGTLRISNTGDYSFVLGENASAEGESAIQALGTGESLTDSFTIIVEDSGGNVAEQTIPLTINGTNDAPTFAEDSISTVYDESIMMATGTLVASDVDNDEGVLNDGLSFSLSSDSEDSLAYGTVSIDADGNYTYTLDPDMSPPAGSTDTFVVEVYDSEGAMDSQEVVIVFPESTIDSEASDENSTVTTLSFADDEGSGESLDGLFDDSVDAEADVEEGEADTVNTEDDTSSDDSETESNAEIGADSSNNTDDLNTVPVMVPTVNTEEVAQQIVTE